MEVDESKQTVTTEDFTALSNTDLNGQDKSYRRINVPPHRMTPLQRDWENIFNPVVEKMRLQIRFNKRKRCIELKTSEYTELPSALQASADFCRAYMLGFDINDALALLRLDDIFLDSFEISDVKTLHGEHLSRAIGRIAGQGGKTKYTIENTTKTRFVIADTHIHILGAYNNIKMAKTAICNIILGSPSGKVYNQMRNLSTRMKERF
jgi:RNA-binding protein PNO1